MASTGNITRRGTGSWRLKFDTDPDPASGKRTTRYVTFVGTKKNAQTELTRLLAAHDVGSLPDPSSLTVAQYLNNWIATVSALTVGKKTAERYKQFIEAQINPFLGAVLLQKLKPNHIADWHGAILEGGGKDGRPLSAQTVKHAHRTLSKALSDAVFPREILTRNPAAKVKPPAIPHREMEILNADELKAVLAGMRDSTIYTEIVTLLATGMRRGELVGLQNGDFDLDRGTVAIVRSVEKTKAGGLRIKSPKTKHGKRTISLPASAVTVLRAHRKGQLEARMAAGLGRPAATAFTFGTLEGGVRDPDRLSQDWQRSMTARGLPSRPLHALRHSHASSLIASGIDVVTVSRRLGHSNPSITMNVYSHLFKRNDDGVIAAIDAVLDLGGPVAKEG
jgi:integrase